MINIMTFTKQSSICKIPRAYFEARQDLGAGAVEILERQFIFDWSVSEKYFRPHVHPCYLFRCQYIMNKMKDKEGRIAELVGFLFVCFCLKCFLYVHTVLVHCIEFSGCYLCTCVYIQHSFLFSRGTVVQKSYYQYYN